MEKFENRDETRIYNKNKFKLGLFGMNCSGALSLTKAPERWDASWQSNVKAAQMADDAGLEFLLPIGRWQGYGGLTDRPGVNFETMTWAAAVLSATREISVFATVHVPRRYYATILPGIPTIRVFEALACGIPLVCAPWDDAEGLFRPGRDYLVARTGAEMEGHLRALRSDAGLRQALAASGLATIRARHTCAHRAEELLSIAASLRAPATLEATA